MQTKWIEEWDQLTKELLLLLGSTLTVSAIQDQPVFIDYQKQAWITIMKDGPFCVDCPARHNLKHTHCVWAYLQAAVVGNLSRRPQTKSLFVGLLWSQHALRLFSAYCLWVTLHAYGNGELFWWTVLPSVWVQRSNKAFPWSWLQTRR